MIKIMPHHRSTLVHWGLVLFLVGRSATACRDALNVDDPTTILDSQVSSAQGADLLRTGALSRLFGVVADAAWQSGLIADEFTIQQPAFFDNEAFPYSKWDLLNRRASLAEQESFWPTRYGTDLQTYYAPWQRLQNRETPLAIEKLERYAPANVRGARVGEMFAVRAYATMRMAEDFCPGFPLHDTRNYTQIEGRAVSTQEAFERALADFDSALTWAADSVRILNFARVARARTLLNLGRFADAATAVASVPTAYVYLAEYTFNPFRPSASGWGFEDSDGRRSVADREGGNGLNFVSAQDPRVMTTRIGTARDGTTGFYSVGKYAAATSPIVLASGIEARLIESEAALQANDPNWLTILNALRAGPGLGALADPGTNPARQDLLLRERAFWLFATGTRLADLRRLVRVYGRTSVSVFPSGTYWRGGTYSSATSIAISRAEKDFGFWCTAL